MHSSCTLCRRRKIRCNRETPCSNCVRSRNGACVYENHPPPAPQPRHGSAEEPQQLPCSLSVGRTSTASTTGTLPTHSSRSLATSSTSASTPGSQSTSTQDVESMKIRIRQLEDQLSRAASTTHSPAPAFNPQTEKEKTSSVLIESSIGGTFQVQHESRLFGQGRAIPLARSILHKTRLFGLSHWINGVVLVSIMVTNCLRREPPLNTGLVWRHGHNDRAIRQGPLIKGFRWYAEM